MRAFWTISTTLLLTIGCSDGSRILLTKNSNSADEKPQTQTSDKIVVNSPQAIELKGESGFSESEAAADVKLSDVDTSIPLTSSNYEKVTFPENDALAADKRQFLWPSDGWISANDTFNSGSAHAGSADIATPYFMPIIAARQGTVESTGTFGVASGWSITIKHENGYSTFYSHMIEPSPLKVGDTVDAGQLIGKVGRTGDSVAPNCHFTIYKTENSTRQKVMIASLKRGIWVKQGTFVPGTYGDLPPLNSSRVSFKVRIEEDKLPFYETADQTKVLGNLTKDMEGTVVGTDKGYFKLSQGGWVVMSSVSLLPVRPYGLRVIKSTTVRTLMDDKSNVYSTLEPDTLLTSFASANGWERVLHRKTSSTAAFRYVRTFDLQPTSQFKTYVGMKSVNLRNGPGTTFESLFNVDDLWTAGAFTVFETKQGWYKIRYKDKDVWIAGWLTVGRI